MILQRKPAAVVLALVACAAAVYSLRAQPGQSDSEEPGTITLPSAPTFNRNLVVLDPAHGGPETGATLGDHVLEKDVDLALAGRLRGALANAGFTVVLTRDSDPSEQLTTDQRAETANRTHAVACIILHATATGSGVHIYTSMLQPAPAMPERDENSSAPFVPISWDAAQAGSVEQSLRLAGDLQSAITAADLPVVVGKAAVRPLDNLTCPAVAIEIAPLRSGSETTPANDPAYQQRVVRAMVYAVGTWRTHADPAPPVAKGAP